MTIHWDRETDLLVAGAGAGGMTAALVAAIEGLETIVCECSEQVGGTTATSAGTIWIPGNRASAAAGFGDSADAARTYLHALIGPAANNKVLDAFLVRGADAVDYLGAHSEVQFVPCGNHPDYRSEHPGAAVSGRALATVPFDGRRLGRDFARVRPPIPEFLLLGGMMVAKDDIPRLIGRFRAPANTWHALKLVARYAADRLRYPRGTRLTMGNALVGRLFHSLRSRNASFLFGARVSELVRDARGAVTGALVDCRGQRIAIRARRGVVLATGGIGHNPRLRERFMPRPVPPHSLAVDTARGDGIEIAERAGARLEVHPPTGLWTPASVTPRPRGAKGLYPHIALDRAKPGLIAVRGNGRRFVDEGASYHDFVEAMFASHRDAEPLVAHLVCDSRFIAKYGIGAILPSMRDLARFERSGYLITGSTLGELAGRLAIDAAALQETVARFNTFAAKGEDPDFGKGRTEVCRFNGDPTHTPNPCLAPLDAPPFYAVSVHAAEIASSSGVATDEHARALEENGAIVEGLYVVGNDMASVMRGSYPGPGTTLGPALTFGYVAGMHAKHGARSLSEATASLGVRPAERSAD